VVLIIGITGACRRQELLNLKVNDVEDLGEFMKTMLPITKTKVPREFTVIKGNFKDLNLVDMVRKYATVCPSHTPHARFFINYKKERCTVQPVGINTFGGLPSKIVNFLELPSAKEYTGHCFSVFIS
jgi:hypothetical protein